MNSLNNTGSNIVIVDDLANNLRVLSEILQSGGYTVRPALNGEIALKSIRSKLPDLILLDVRMPGMDGYEVCRQLKSDPMTREIPVIFISALNDIEDKLAAFNAGGADYISKPFQMAEVLARVATHTALFKSRQALKAREECLQRSLRDMEAAHLRLKEMSSELLQSEKLASIGLLAAGVAHEINNPIGFISSDLNILKSYVGSLLRLIDEYALLETNAPDDMLKRIDETKQEIDLPFLRQDVMELIGESIDGSERVCKIVQDLRDFSHPGDSEWRQVNLNTALDSSLNLAWNEINHKAEVIKDYDDVPMVECLYDQISQVFVNLLVNAAQAIGEKGQITLRTRSENEWVTVSVIDNGCGIASENTEKIFDPFFTTRPVGKGTGLGLSTSYGIITKHGGRIVVDSAVEKGAAFTVWLPVKRSDSA
ncbi:response regulator [Candidatus Methylobacter oryzae]|uniref:histidine kinase n=1 Tax=Candidatus Methylobacter oryzae TaxID=2497749 RepID=A0ABY3CB15_9GAMM|nr:response regulator [Candidatus Methylobacter oryzae]TRW95872.1 response regulator [Candidatus Methylobacter oryzae]